MDDFVLNVPEDVLWGSAAKEVKYGMVSIDDIKLKDAVFDALKEKCLHDLLGIIGQLAAERKELFSKANSLECRVYDLSGKVNRLENENEQLQKKIAQLTGVKRRKNYDLMKIMKTYRETRSFRKTGEICECSAKTVKALLEEIDFDFG